MKTRRIRTVGGALLVAATIAAAAARGAAAQVATCAAGPRYQAQTYNTDYLFAATRDVREGIESRTAVAALSPFTVALDVALLPFEFALGFFN